MILFGRSWEYPTYFDVRQFFLHFFTEILPKPLLQLLSGFKDVFVIQHFTHVGGYYGMMSVLRTGSNYLLAMHVYCILYMYHSDLIIVVLVIFLEKEIFLGDFQAKLLLSFLV